MKRLLCILLFVSASAQTQADRIKLDSLKQEERYIENLTFALAGYTFGALFSASDATQDAITYSPFKRTRWGLDHGDYHMIKGWRNAFLVGTGVSVGLRFVYDISAKVSWFKASGRALARLLGIGAVNYLVWDMAYYGNRYGTPITLNPAHHQHWSGFDRLDALTRPKTRNDVILIYGLKLTLVAILIYFDEL